MRGSWVLLYKNNERCIQNCIKSLEKLQHRGRESSGISYYNDEIMEYLPKWYWSSKRYI